MNGVVFLGRPSKGVVDVLFLEDGFKTRSVLLEEERPSHLGKHLALWP